MTQYYHGQLVRLISSYYYYYVIRTQSTSNTISTLHKNQQITTSNGEKEKMIELNELKRCNYNLFEGDNTFTS